MSLLRTAQSTDNGVMRLTSYQRSRRDGTDLLHGPANAAHVDRLIDVVSTSQQQQYSEVTASSGIYTNNSATTDEELHDIIGNHSHLLDGGSTRASSNESRDPMNDSMPYGSSSRGRSSTGTGDSSFSVSRIYNNYSVSPSRQRYSTPPPRRQATPPKLRSPSKSFDSAGKRKISLNDPMSFQSSVMVGKVQVQNASAPSSPSSRRSPLSPRQSLSPTRQRSVPAAMSFEKVDTQGRTLAPSQGKSEAYERASRLLKKVDASKQAALKVEKAREAAREAMEKAKRARLAKLNANNSNSSGTTMSSSQGTPKKIRFSDEIQEEKQQQRHYSPRGQEAKHYSPRGQEEKHNTRGGGVHDVEEITIPSNNINTMSRSHDDDDDDNNDDEDNSKDDDKYKDIPILSDEDSTSTVQDRYGVDESHGNRYEVANAEEDEIDDVLDYEASKKRKQEHLPPLSPTRKSGDDLNDMMDLAESLLIGNVGAVSTADETGGELTKEVNECIADACSFTDELGCGSDAEKVDDTAVKVAAANPVSPTKRYPMPQNPAVLERVLEDQGILGTPPPSPPPEVMDSVAYRVQKNAMSNENAIHDQTAHDDDASHGDELDDIMNFAAGLLGSKSVAQSTPVESPTKRRKSKGKSKNKSPTKSRQEPVVPTIPDNLGEGDELDDIMDFAAGLLGSKQPVAPQPPPRKKTSPQGTINASSIVEPMQTSQAVPNIEPKKVDERSCLADACSVWGEELFRNPKEEVVVDAAGNTVLKGSKEEATKPSLLHVATKGPPVPPPPEAFSLKPVPSERTPTSVPTLADDLTDKSNPSSNLDLPDYLEQYESHLNEPFVPIVTTIDEEDEPHPSQAQQNASESELPIHPKPVHPEPFHPATVTVPSKSEQEPMEIDNAVPDSEKPSKADTILDSNDEYWDTLSTIASNSKDMSVNRISHPHPHGTNAIPEERPVALNSLVEGAPFSAILCSWLGMEQQNGGLKRPNPIGPADTFGETNGDTMISTEASLLPKIPSMIEYHAPPVTETKDKAPTELLNTVETLITKRSSDSSDSTESFYLQNASNLLAEASEQDIDKAIIRGQKMASPTSPMTSRYGDDKGDEPLGSPSHRSHASNSSPGSPNSRKVTDRRKPWNKDAESTSSGNFRPVKHDASVTLGTEDSELAAMLGIKKVASSDKAKDEAKDERPLSFVSGSNSQDSSLDDLLMVLTRSAGDDEDGVIENMPSTLGTSSPKKSSVTSLQHERSVKSPESEKIEEIISSLKRAETMGHDEDSVEMVSSPQSAKCKGVKPEDRISSPVPKQKDSDSQIVQKNTSCAVMDILFADEGNALLNTANECGGAQQKHEKAKSTPPVSPTKSTPTVSPTKFSPPTSPTKSTPTTSPTKATPSMSPKKSTPSTSPERQDSIAQAVNDLLLKDRNSYSTQQRQEPVMATPPASPTKSKGSKKSTRHSRKDDSNNALPTSPKKQDSIIQTVHDLLLKGASQDSAMTTPPASPTKSRASSKSPRRSRKNKSSSDGPAKLEQAAAVSTSPNATNAQSSNPPKKQSKWAEMNAAANAAAAKELEMQQKIDAQASRNEGTSIIDAFFDGGSSSPTANVPSMGDQQDPPTPSRPQEYVSPSQSDEDDLEVMQSPTDLAVRMSPVKELRVTATEAKKADDISSVSSRQSLESKTKVMSDLLSKYDKIIDQLVHDKSISNSTGTSRKADDVETTITELRQQKVYAEALQRSKKTSRESSPRKTQREEETQTSPVRKRTSSPKVLRDEQFTSQAIGKTSPKRNVTEATQSRTSASPTRSPRRPMQQQQLRPLVTKSPTRSPRRPSQLASTTSRTNLLSNRAAARSAPPTRLGVYSSPSKASSPRVDESSSGSRIHKELSSNRASMSPTRSPRRTRSTALVQSRDQVTPTRSSGHQERTSAFASPSRRAQSSRRSRSRPRPEDKIQEMRRRRAESLSPKKRRGDPYGRRGSSELDMKPYISARGRSDLHGDPYGRRGSDLRRDSPTRATVRAVKRVYSPEHHRHSQSHDWRNLDNSSSSGSEESEYGRRSREIKRELKLCQRASDSIQHTHDELFDELGIFQDKLLRHSRRKDHERAFISESRNAVNEFQHRLERVREHAHQTSVSGRETPDTLDQVEHALEEAWEDFDDVRGAMLNNLRLLNEAKEELMRERLYREEVNDDEQLHMLENMIQEIRQSHHVRDSRSNRRNEPPQYRSKYNTASSSRADRSRSAPVRARAGYNSTTRGTSGYLTSTRDHSPYVPTTGDRKSRAGYSPSNRSSQYSRTTLGSERYSSYR